MKPVTAYDLVRISLAGVLLLAAGLKGYQLATEPVLGTGLLDSRWFLIGVVEFELFFGLWLLANFWPQWTRRTAIACFAVFAAVSLYKALSGAGSCGCFGHVVVNPWYTFGIDVAAIVALLQWRPSGAVGYTASLRQASVLRAVAVVVAWLLIGLPAAMIMSEHRAPAVAEDGVIAGDNSLVVLEPKKWSGKRFPLLPFIVGEATHYQLGEHPLREHLSDGEWFTILYHHECPKCQKLLRAVQMNADHFSSPVALLELPPYGNAPENDVLRGAGMLSGRVNDSHEWFVQTPVLLLLRDGQVVQWFPSMPNSILHKGNFRS